MIAPPVCDPVFLICLVLSRLALPTSTTSLFHSAYVLLYVRTNGVDYFRGGLDFDLEFILKGIEYLRGALRGCFGFSLQDAERVAHRAKVGCVLYFQYERQRAINDDLHEVCWHRLAVSAIDARQRVLKASAEACSVLAERGWPCGLLRSGYRHGTLVVVGATAGCWLVNWR